MRFHKVLIVGIHQILNTTFFENGIAEKELEKLFKRHKKWGSRDRSFVAESFFNIIRWKRKLELFSDHSFSKNNTYHILAAYLIWNYNTLPAFDVFRNIDVENIKNRIKKTTIPPEVGLSYANWFFNELVSGYKENAYDLMSDLNKPAFIYLRTNTFKTSTKNLLTLLKKEGINAEVNKLSPNSIKILKRKKLSHLKSYKNGLFSIQDISSQQVALLAKPLKNKHIVDACAGAGGKSLHLADLMQNTGQIISLDIFENKLNELENRAKRCGYSNIKTVLSTPQKIQKLNSWADIVLIDAPCSGSGVIRRKPQTKWNVLLNDIKTLIKTQKAILENYASIVKKDGKLIYATCSILPIENQNQVEWFTKKNKNFKLIKEQQILPKAFDGDGFYIAILRRV